MLKRVELSDPNSCLNNAQEEEPVFVLLGRDPAAAFAIRMWALERVKSGRNNLDDRQIIEARALADLMETFSRAVRDHVIAARPKGFEHYGRPALNPRAAWPFPSDKPT